MPHPSSGYSTRLIPYFSRGTIAPMSGNQISYQDQEADQQTTVIPVALVLTTLSPVRATR